MDTGNNHYPDFEYAGSQLSAFALSIDTFVISLKDGNTTRFRPEDVEDFKKWLAKHRVRDIAIDDGIPKQSGEIHHKRKTK